MVLMSQISTNSQGWVHLLVLESVAELFQHSVRAEELGAVSEVLLFFCLQLLLFFHQN